MIQILLHSSKTMRAQTQQRPRSVPMFQARASELASVFHSVPISELMTLMKLSEKKAREVKTLYDNWSTQPGHQVSAVDAFIGDIYSGLQVPSWSEGDRNYAQHHLLILSGLYGALRPGDAIAPYRLEMGYKLPDGTSLYTFWGDTVTSALPDSTSIIINLSAVEYTKALLPYVQIPIVTPKFLTISPKTGEPTFVTVHAKIARGAFANWLIQSRASSTDELPRFSELGYQFDASLSSPGEPVFVCQEFMGIGLSIRLT